MKSINQAKHPKVLAYNDSFDINNLMDPKNGIDFLKVLGFVFFGSVNFLVAVNKDASLPSGKIDMC